MGDIFYWSTAWWDRLWVQAFKCSGLFFTAEEKTGTAKIKISLQGCKIQEERKSQGYQKSKITEKGNRLISGRSRPLKREEDCYQL